RDRVTVLGVHRLASPPVALAHEHGQPPRRAVHSHPAPLPPRQRRTPRTTSMPNQTAASAPISVPRTYAAATPGRPAASRVRVCTAYVEKVVNPPSTPVPRNGRAS